MAFPRPHVALAAATLSLALTACGGEPTGPPVPASVTVDRPAVALTWIGESAQVAAQVKDKKGAAVTGQTTAWSSSNIGVATVTTTGLISAVGRGTATITVLVGTVSGTTAVTVTPAPTAILKVFGDAQRGNAGAALRDSLVAELRDKGGTPIAGASVTWAVESGGGNLTSSQGVTDAAGRAFGRWTLGAAVGAQAVRVTAEAAQVQFTAEATVPMQASFSPTSVTIKPVEPTDLTLSVTGGPAGAQAAWTCATSNASAATTQGTATGCRVVGVSAGSATITAAVTKGSSTATASAPVTVSAAAGGVTIASVQPGVLVEGASATIQGTGFSATAASNQVTLGGLIAFVSAATTTSVTITVPRSECLPPRKADLVVTTATGSASASVGVTPGSQADLVLPVRNYRYTFAGNGCLVLPGSAAGGEYLIGIVSTSQSPSSLAALSLVGTSGDATVVLPAPAGGASSALAGGTAAWEASAPSVSPPAGLIAPPPAALRELAQLRGDAHADRTARNRAVRAELGTVGPALVPQGVPAQVVAGDLVSVYANYDRTCSAGTQIQTVVRLVGNSTIWLEDKQNPTTTFTDAELAALDAFYSANTKPVHDGYFGGLSDVDVNQRIVIVLTKEVNKASLGGWVWWGDLYPTALCSTSNRAELFFGYVPDPNGVHGLVRTKQSVLEYYPSLLTHEITHLVQGNAAVFGSAGDKTDWEVEGGASFAEQLAGYRVYGHASGQNLGYAQFNAGRDWYWNAWLYDMVAFFGWNSAGDGSGHRSRAPEECAWIGRSSQGNTGPCEGSHVYGVPSMVLRFVLDRWGATYPGGEAALMRRLTTSPSSGFGSLEEVSGWRIEQILAEFYQALWADGRTAPDGARMNYFGMSSWDLFDVFNRFPAPTQLQPYTSTASAPQLSASVRGGSTTYLLWRPSGSLAPTSLKVTTQGGGLVPGFVSVWALRLR